MPRDEEGFYKLPIDFVVDKNAVPQVQFSAERLMVQLEDMAAAISGEPAELEALVVDQALLKVNNLSDLPSPEAARTALGLKPVAASGSYVDLINKPTIPPGQVAADWNATSGVAQVLNKPNLGTAAGYNVGVDAGQVVALDSSGRLPSVDGSQLTNLVVSVPVNLSALTPQQAFELGLQTATRDVIGSTTEAFASAMTWGQTTAEAALQHLHQTVQNGAAIQTEQTVRAGLAQQVTTLSAALDISNAAIVTEQNARASGDAANAASISTVAAQAVTLSASVTTLSSASASQGAAIASVEAQWGVVISVNGQVTGLVRLDGGLSGSSFVVVADKFIVANPSNSTDTKQVFVIGNVNGTSTVGINGNLLVDGSILARSIRVSSLDALSANFGTVTAGYIKDNASSPTYIFDVANGKIGSQDGKVYFDMKNKIFHMQT